MYIYAREREREVSVCVRVYVRMSGKMKQERRPSRFKDRY